MSDLIPKVGNNLVNNLIDQVKGIAGKSGIEPFYGDESDGALNTTGNVTLTSVLNGPPIIRQHTSININTGHVFTVSQPCQGLILYATGDVVIDGSIGMSQRAAAVPSFAALEISKLSNDELTAKIVSKLATLKGGAGGNGGNGGNGNFGDSASSGGTAASGRTLQGGFGAGGGGGGANGAGFSGGDGGDISNDEIGGGSGQVNRIRLTSTSDALANGLDGIHGAGGGGTSRSNMTSTPGEGSGAGGTCFGAGGGGVGAAWRANSVNGSNGQYAAGFLCIIAKGSVTINGNLFSNGGNGGSGSNSNDNSGGEGGGGGGAGGGVVAIFHAGTYTNNGNIQVDGGNGGASGGSTGSLPAQPGQSGSVGTISINDINNL